MGCTSDLREKIRQDYHHYSKKAIMTSCVANLCLSPVNNRTDAITWMSANYPYSSTAQFANANSRCGNTAVTGIMQGFTVASEVYDNCTIGGKQVLNGTPTNSNALQDTTAHESGHAFDFIWSLKYGSPSVPPSTSVGFKMQVNGVNSGVGDRSDLYYLKLGNSASGGTPPPTCQVFGTQVPSALEIDLGNKAYSTAVCGGSPAAVIKPYTGLTNDVIAEDVSPYFFGNPPPAGGGNYAAELFAEEFAIIAGGSTHTALPFIDKVQQSLGCTSGVLYGLINSNNPIAQPGAFCPPATAKQFTQ
jgi:hypothetical protein